MKGVIGNVTVKFFGPPAGPVTGAVRKTKLLKTVVLSAPTLSANVVLSVVGVRLVVERSNWTEVKKIMSELPLTAPSGRNAICEIVSGPDAANWEAA